jgi:release factor glutamine methyltransferase
MRDFIAFAKDCLKSTYPPQEISQISRLLLEKMAGLDSMQFYGGKDIKIPVYLAVKLREAVERLVKHEPLQYILGETEFSGLTLHIRPGVLIPRPETEELVELIARDFKQRGKIRILDICTGSGCIALALYKKFPDSVVEAWELSAEALQIAMENAKINSATILFRKLDVLNFKPSLKLHGTMDIMVSNPPYVCRSEQKVMESKVMDFEPHLALFVEDKDPLVFYRSIADIGVKMLRKGGCLYFEINSLLWKETMDLINSFPFSDVSIHKDISGRERFIKVQK